MSPRPPRSPFRVPFLALTTAAGLALVGCATPQQAMQASLGNPASQGTVEAVEGVNGNTKVTVQVQHLAPANRLYAEATVYVVWIQPRNGTPQNVGAMNLNENLEGKLETLTPHRSFRLLVTPEPASMVDQPTHEAVFTSNVERSD